MTLHRAYRACLPLLAAVALTACAGAIAERAEPVAVPAAFTDAGGAAPLPERWWTAFGDPVLDDLETAALSGSFSLRETWARLDQARATARKKDAALAPTLDAGVGVAGSRQRKRSTNANSGKAWVVENASEFELGLTGGYEVDLWGALSSEAEAAALDLRASEDDLRAAALTLTAEVANAWFTLVEANGQIDLLTATRATYEQVLDLTEVRFRGGQVAATDVLQQRQLVESVRGDLATAEADAAVARNALAILIGRPAGTPDIPRVNDLVPLPPLPATGLPAELVGERPDVRKARLAVRAADHRVAVAIADRYPSLSLTAGVSTSAENARDLLDNWLATLAANVVAPLFDAGARKAEVDRARAVVEESLAAYGRTILEALGEVEDALVREARQRDHIDSLDRQIALYDEVVARMRDRYLGGAVDYLSVLNALVTNQKLERNRLAAELQLLAYRIDLCRALGRGWPLERPRPLAAESEEEPES